MTQSITDAFNRSCKRKRERKTSTVKKTKDSCWKKYFTLFTKITMLHLRFFVVYQGMHFLCVCTLSVSQCFSFVLPPPLHDNKLQIEQFICLYVYIGLFVCKYVYMQCTHRRMCVSIYVRIHTYARLCLSLYALALTIISLSMCG